MAKNQKITNQRRAILAASEAFGGLELDNPMEIRSDADQVIGWTFSTLLDNGSTVYIAITTDRQVIPVPDRYRSGAAGFVLRAMNVTPTFRAVARPRG